MFSFLFFVELSVYLALSGDSHKPHIVALYFLVQPDNLINLFSTNLLIIYSLIIFVNHYKDDQFLEISQ